jgi:outer membrane protein
VKRHLGEFVLAGFARYDTLDGAVFEDSPLVEIRDYLVVGLVFGWILGESEARVEH